MRTYEVIATEGKGKEWESTQHFEFIAESETEAILQAVLMCRRLDFYIDQITAKQI